MTLLKLWTLVLPLVLPLVLTAPLGGCLVDDSSGPAALAVLTAGVVRMTTAVHHTCRSGRQMAGKCAEQARHLGRFIRSSAAYRSAGVRSMPMVQRALSAERAAVHGQLGRAAGYAMDAAHLAREVRVGPATLSMAGRVATLHSPAGGGAGGMAMSAMAAAAAGATAGVVARATPRGRLRLNREVGKGYESAVVLGLRRQGLRMTQKPIAALLPGEMTEQRHLKTGEYTARLPVFSVRNGRAVREGMRRVRNSKGHYRIPDIVVRRRGRLEVWEAKCVEARPNTRLGRGVSMTQGWVGAQALGFAVGVRQAADAMGVRPAMHYAFCNVGAGWMRPIIMAAGAAYGVRVYFHKHFGLPGPIPATVRTGMLQGLLMSGAGVTMDMANTAIDIWLDL